MRNDVSCLTRIHILRWYLGLLLLPPPLLLVYSAGTSNPDALQDQRELDAVEKEALVQPMGTHLHQIAEKAKGKGTLRHNTVQKLGPGNRYTV